MNTKVLLAALAVGVASFFLGWLVYGILLDPYMKANTTVEGLAIMKNMENMNMMGMAIANLAGGLLVAWLLSRMGITTAMGGLFPGAVIGCLMTVMYDMFFYSMMNMYSSKMVVIVDVLASTVFYAVLGAVAGWVLGMGRKATTA
ncbi:MAG: DUF1761 family protein [Flavobacteriales bacterium]